MGFLYFIVILKEYTFLYLLKNIINLKNKI